MTNTLLTKKFNLILFSIFVSIISYGFALTNYSLAIDSESPAYSDYSMSLGRWGTNLFRYRIFEGHLPYFTLLFGLIFLSLSSVELTKIFKLKGVYSYIFCTLFLTFPQHAYQLAFTMQADAVPFGFFCSVVAVNLFNEGIKNTKNNTSLLKLVFSCLLIMFTISIYQALIFIPIITYAIYFCVNINDEFQFKDAFKKLFYFIILLIVSVILYYISIKIFCPPIESGYLSSYTSGDSNNRIISFYNIWVDNIWGNFYYGDKTFMIATIASLILFIFFIKQKRFFVLKSFCLLFLLIGPFIISFFISNGTNPPRLYVGSGIVFGFIIISTLKLIREKYIRNILFLILIIVLTNIYFITNLFYSSNKIFKHDIEVAKKINNTINDKFSNFDENEDYVYFYGALPESNHEKLRLPNSEVFGGSLFSWDGGNNWRIINFFKFNDIAYYKFLDNKETFDKIKDSIQPMPLWPNPDSVKKINNVVIVKIGDTKGVQLPIE
ncbi:hypothetical protein FIA58_007960 [Flavobacterium jejuense]|uniref:Glycosyltransferase RgtA/B/C/D-like domain-containing protein n=1 Tax=Flavobacterium jejuense TaxID=1544455 RepID=A0ABX0IS38_9FLAO|nr:glucosyltransferase domain-containing protein [Flavobacterium jejuense]NHN25609.1 hypothetical protein [Flavobacterium jejuense]